MPAPRSVSKRGSSLPNLDDTLPDSGSLIEWNDALSVHNSEIDAEHRHFIALVNELNTAIISRCDKAEVERIMGLILDDAVAHFAHEERLFFERGFPLAQEHSHIHHNLSQTLRSALEQIHQSEFGREWIAIGLAIRNQLVNHLVSVDSQYIAYLSAK